MRSEQEMLELILHFAREHDDIRAVIMNGSRANPNIPRDPFQDYDIDCLVRSVAPFRNNPEIVRYFGDIMILQKPEDMEDPPPANTGRYAYLMQFMDGNRIDLGFTPMEYIRQLRGDTLTIVLLDKDNLMGDIPPSNEGGYLPARPTVKAFDDCCNEFWWLNVYVAKALWREELILAKHILDANMRPQLMKMLTWTFGLQTGFRVAPGKMGKRFRGVMGEELWALLERTYADARLENSWEALFAIGDLFRRVAHPVAAAFGFAYPEQDDANVCAYIRRIKELPRDAKTL
jgi:aminoglycoside 6-adenylyltransferase